jgi:glycosyltransferase involved in cell wall biosynthesis
VVPTHKRPELLRRAVADIVEQTYEGDIEIIVVFDKEEPDESIVMSEGNRLVRVMANDRTPGLAGGRNTGVLSARGELLAFCDDDDEWLPTKVEKQVALLATADGPTLVACGIEVRRGDKSVVRAADPNKLTYEDFLDSRIMEVNPCTILVNRELVIEKIGLVDEEIPGSWGEDYEWLLRAAQLCEIKTLEEPLTVIHWGLGSFFADRYRTIAEAIDYIMAKYPDFDRAPIGKSRLLGQKAFAMAALGERKEALALAKESLKLNPKDKRAPLAILVALRLAPADGLLKLANRMGRGI